MTVLEQLGTLAKGSLAVIGFAIVGVLGSMILTAYIKLIYTLTLWTWQQL